MNSIIIDCVSNTGKVGMVQQLKLGHDSITFVQNQ